MSTVLTFAGLGARLTGGTTPQAGAKLTQCDTRAEGPHPKLYPDYSS